MQRARVRRPTGCTPLQINSQTEERRRDTEGMECPSFKGTPAFNANSDTLRNSKKNVSIACIAQWNDFLEKRE
jgi:hypothetical protein